MPKPYDQNKYNIMDMSLDPSPENLDTIAHDLLALASKESVSDEPTQRVVGRCMAQIIPAYFAWLKSEIAQNEDKSPGRCVAASARTFASLAGVVTLLASQGREKTIKKAASLVGSVFVHDMQEIVDNSHRIDHDAHETKH